MDSELLDYELYLKMELGRSKNTCASYIYDISQFRNFLKTKRVSNFENVTKENILDWISVISKNSKETTQSRKLSALKSLAGYLVEQKTWTKNLVELVNSPKIVRSIPDSLSKEDVDKILSEPRKEVFEEIRDRAMLETMYCSGLRVSEVCSLKHSDFDMAEKILRIKGKGNKVRLVPIARRALDAIGKYFVERKKMNSSAPELFITKRGSKLSRKTFWYNIKKYATRIPLGREVSPHLLRHSFATHLLSAGADLISIKEMLGHSDLATTQIYTKVETKRLISEYIQKHPRKKMKI